MELLKPDCKRPFKKKCSGKGSVVSSQEYEIAHKWSALKFL